MVRFINIAHWAILLFVLTAWLWPWQAAWWTHVLFVPIMILHWRTNRNRCFLSQLEERFRTKGTAAVADVEVQESHFIRSVIKKIFGVEPSDSALEWINYAVMASAWAASVFRLVGRIS
jgi:hypothetical protein